MPSSGKEYYGLKGVVARSLISKEFTIPASRIRVGRVLPTSSGPSGATKLNIRVVMLNLDYLYENQKENVDGRV
jgi:hypothetical protein